MSLKLDTLLQPIGNPNAYRVTEKTDPTHRYHTVTNNLLYNDVLEQETAACSLLAHIRWQVMALARRPYARLTGVNIDIVRDTESAKHAPTLPTRFNTLHRLIGSWNEQEVPEDIIQATIDAIVGKYRNTIFGLLLEYEYRFGHGKVAEITGRNLAAYRVYRDSEALIPFKDIERILDEGDGVRGIDAARAAAIWRAEAERIYCENRKVPHPLAEIHIRDELAGERTLTRVETGLGLNLKRTPEFALARFTMPPWEAASPVITPLFGKHELAPFRIQYDRARTQEHIDERFFETYRRMQREQGITDYMLKVMLGASGRPSRFLRDPAIEGKDMPPSDAPPGLIAHAIGKTEGDVDDLINCFFRDRTTFKERIGTSNAHNELRMQREIWGVTKDQLLTRIATTKSTNWVTAWNAVIRCRNVRPAITARTLTRYENGEQGIITPEIAEALEDIVHEIGMLQGEKVRTVRESYTQPKAVPEAVMRMAEKAGGRVPWESVQLRDLVRPTLEPHIHQGFVSRESLHRYTRGIETPPLPVLKAILDASNAKCTEDLEIDWGFQYARQLAGNIVIPSDFASPKSRKLKRLRNPVVHEPLARALHVIMEEIEPSMNQFSRRRFGGSGSMPTDIAECVNHGCNLTAKMLQHQKHTRHWQDLWPLIEQILRAADVEEGSPRWMCVQMLHEFEQDSGKTLRWLRKKFGTKLREDFRDLPGFLQEEI